MFSKVKKKFMFPKIVYRGKIWTTTDIILEKKPLWSSITKKLISVFKCFHCQSLFALLILGFAFSLVCVCVCVRVRVCVCVCVCACALLSYLALLKIVWLFVLKMAVVYTYGKFVRKKRRNKKVNTYSHYSDNT